MSATPCYGNEHQVIAHALRSFRQRLLSVPRAVLNKGGDLGPLTELDTAMDRQLHEQITRAFRGDGWLSEESPHESATGRTWIIDPVDGTRELVAGIPEWAVSVGLWADGRPLYGWIYNPPTDRLWHGGPGCGAWRDDVPVRVTCPRDVASCVVGVSRTDTARGLLPPVQPPPRGVGSIAYKLGLVGGGELDATVSVTPKNIWDVAGGIAVVLGAGGVLIRYDNGRIIDRVDDLNDRLSGGLVAAHPTVAEPLRRHWHEAARSARSRTR